MGKTALVTGASRGIGRAVAEALAREGWKVAVNYCSSREKAEQLTEYLKSQYGAAAFAVQADVSDPAQVERMFSDVERELGGGDLLVNNAGIASQKLFTDISPEEWDRLFAVDVRGVFLCCRAALPHMIHWKKGSIINISSIWGVTGASCEVHYSAAKAAVIGLTKALAKEVGPSGIRVNCIAPGVIDTEMNGHLSPETMEELREETPLECIGTPEDIAQAVLFLASPGAQFITGQVLGVNGGFLI